MASATVTKLYANAGRIGQYWVCIVGDDIYAAHDDRAAVTHTAPNYGTSLGELAQRPGFRTGWALLTGGDEVLYFYDQGDDNFGYALNVTAPHFSEWGYAPF